MEINQCVGCSDTATLSSRRRVDGVEVDAAIQDERAVNLISPQVCARAHLEDVVADVVFGRVAKPREALRTCVEINQCVSKSFLGDDAAVLAPLSGEEPALPRRRAGVASMAWRSTGRFSTNAL